MDKKFIIILAVVVLGLGGLFVFAQSKNSKDGTNSSSSNASVSNHSKGNNTKNVELLVYGDFECPACAQYFPIEKQVTEKYNDQIKFTFRHYPLDSIHPNARGAHRAAEAAGKQGKFFEMHDLLYENRNQWVELSNGMPAFEQFATDLGLNIEQFKSDFEAEQTNATINADKKEGNSKDVSGTPTYFVNGKKIDNSQLTSFEGFSKVIDDAINSSGN
jgi:protein-disulfide isomerase